MYTLREKVAWFAIISRLFVVVIQVLLNVVIPDHQADAFIAPRNPNDEVGVFDRAVLVLFGGFLHWDSEYFLHVARYGYTHENCLAFFPLYPLCIRWTSVLLTFFLGSLLNPGSIFLMSSVLLNVILFVWTALILYDLSEMIFADKGMAYRSAILFCASPSTIFFVAPYSEILFALLTFRGMMEVEKGLNGTISGSIPFGLAAATRSNGLVNVGFAVHAEARHITDTAMTKGWQAAFLKALNSSWRLLLGVCIMVAPFATFQGYATVKFCNPMMNENRLPEFLEDFITTNKLVVPGSNNPPSWCNSSLLVLPYTAVQSHYWNVGFLRYYHWKQIPNFLLALPIAVLVTYGSCCFCKQHRHLCYNLGLWQKCIPDRKSATRDKLQQPLIKERRSITEDSFPPGMFVYIIHALSLLIICFLFIHVQVTTRMIASASPIPYWFAAYFVLPIYVAQIREEDLKPLVVPQLKENAVNLQIESATNLCSLWRVFIIYDIRCHSSFMKLSSRKKTVSRLIQVYFISYALIGIFLFCNNFPWT